MYFLTMLKTTLLQVVADVMTQHDVNQRLHELMSATMPIWQLLMKAAPIRMMQCMRAMHGVINSKQVYSLAVALAYASGNDNMCCPPCVTASTKRDNYGHKCALTRRFKTNFLFMTHCTRSSAEKYVQEKELVDSIQSSLQFTSEQRQCMASWWLGGLRQKSQAAEGFKSAIRKIHKLVESSQTEVQEHQKFLEHVGVQEDPVTEIVAGMRSFI